MYRDYKCGNSLYEHQRHINLTRKKDVGILQFTKIGHMRGDEEKRMAKLKEFTRPEDNLRSDLMFLNFDVKSSKTDSKNAKSSKGKKQFVRNTSL